LRGEKPHVAHHARQEYNRFWAHESVVTSFLTPAKIKTPPLPIINHYFNRLANRPATIDQKGSVR